MHSGEERASAGAGQASLLAFSSTDVLPTESAEKIPRQLRTTNDQ